MRATASATFICAAMVMGLANLPGHAEVLRCIDALGRISYNNEGSCPAGARQNGVITEPTPAILDAPVPEDGTGRGRVVPPADVLPAVPPVVRAPVAPSAQAAPGLAIIDGRPNPSQGERGDDRWSDRSVGGDLVIDDGYGYPGAVPYGRPARPLRDQRPRLRDCDASGCADNLGNRYDRSGRLTQYQRPDGKVCTPVGSSQVCR